MERFQQGVRKRTLLAKKKVQNITKEDVKSYLFRNAFVLLTVTAVIVGKSFDNKTPFQNKQKKTGSCFSGASDCLGKLSDELIVGIQKNRPGFPLNLKIPFFPLYMTVFGTFGTLVNMWESEEASLGIMQIN